jgi:hypothetical protein
VIDDIVRKLRQDVAPSTCLEERRETRRTRDQRQCAIDFSIESFCGLDTPFEVPLEGVVDFEEGFRDEINLGVAHSTSPEIDCG